MTSLFLLPFSEGYVPPNNEQLAMLKSSVGWTTMDLAKCAAIKDKHLRMLFSERNYLKGKVVEYYVWRFWLESFQLVEDFKLKPKPVPVRENVLSFNKDWLPPTFDEFNYITRRTGHSSDTLAPLLSMPPKLIESMKTKMSNDVVRISQEKWQEFCSHYNFNSFSDLVNAPSLFAASLSTLPSYQAPRPVQLRQFVAWTGYSPEELEEQFGIPSNKLGYFMSNRSTRSTDATITEKIFSRENWVSPFSRELRSIINVKRCDPGMVAKMLRIRKADVYTYLRSPNSIRLHLNQDDWFAFLDKIGVFKASDINNILNKESNISTIPYSAWRLMLSTFGLIEHERLNHLEK